MRKKKWALPYLATRDDVVVNDPTIYKGRWKELLGCEKLHLEIGSGKGSYWNGMANKYPLEGWIGLEKVSDVAAMAVRSCENPLPTMKFIVKDASNLLEWFQEGELDYIHLNFSDPWPKKGHTKRRLTSESFLQMYLKILSKEGRVILKTDNIGLFEFSLESMEKDFKLLEKWEDFRKETHDEDVITEYEANFMSLGQPIYRAIWTRGETK